MFNNNKAIPRLFPLAIWEHSIDVGKTGEVLDLSDSLHPHMREGMWHMVLSGSLVLIQRGEVY